MLILRSSILIMGCTRFLLQNVTDTKALVFQSPSLIAPDMHNDDSDAVNFFTVFQHQCPFYGLLSGCNDVPDNFIKLAALILLPTGLVFHCNGYISICSLLHHWNLYLRLFFKITFSQKKVALLRQLICIPRTLSFPLITNNFVLY